MEIDLTESDVRLIMVVLSNQLEAIVSILEDKGERLRFYNENKLFGICEKLQNTLSLFETEED